MLAALQLEVVENAGARLTQIGLATLLEPPHTQIVPDRAKAATGDWRLATLRASMRAIRIRGGAMRRVAVSFAVAAC
jgi:hypothetical protein